MKTLPGWKTLSLLALAMVCHSSLFAVDITVTLNATNTGFNWYERWQWMGGNSTDEGFSRGDDGTGLIHAQNNYQYYGGADRFFQRKDTYLQISLFGLDKTQIESVSLWLYVAANNSAVPTFLTHVNTQNTRATGDAAQKLPSDTNVVSTAGFVLGWNEIDVTSYVLSDLDKQYDYAAFGIPQFSQSQDDDRLLSLYGGSTTQMVNGESAAPRLVAVIPEPTTLALLIPAALVISTFLRRRR